MTTMDRFAPRDATNPAGALYRDFEVRVETRDDAPDGDTRLAIAISSEAAVERYDYSTGERYLEVLDHSTKGPDLTYARDGLPFCLDHSLSRQIGLLEDVRVDADGVIRGLLREGNHPDASWAVADMRAGIRKKVSIGYWPGTQYTQQQGARGATPTRRYTGWTLYEASTVAVPADYDVGVGRDARGIAPTDTHSPAAGETPHTQEVEMHEKDTSERGAAPAPDTRAQELAVLATDAGMTERAADWIVNGTSVADARREVMTALRERAAAAPQISTGTTPVVTQVHEREADKPWGSFTEFMRAVAKANTGRLDVRLGGERAATGMGIGSDPDGGFMVPEQYAQGVITRAFEGGDILGRCRRIPVTGNQYHMSLVDEVSRANGSRWGGIQSYRLGEGTAVTASKPKIRRATLDVTKKIGVACYVSEEQLQDAAATDTILTTAMSEEVMVRTEGEIWAGLGAAECLGITNSGAFVTVTKVNAQTAATVVAGNVTKMNARLWTGSQRTAAWFINQQVLEQLPLMTIGQQPVYLPPTGVVGSSPFGTLLGKPVFVTEHASVLGTAGDIVLADFTQYAIGEKAMTSVARSMHVKFLEGEEVFRLIYRVDGLPLWNAPLTLKDGTTTVSPFVTVETRA
jgi:HK97 family phage major capsid protein